MASLRKKGKVYEVRLCHHGQRHRIGLGRISEKKAQLLKSKIETALAELELGMTQMPKDVPLEKFLLFGDRADPEREAPGTVHDMLERYQQQHQPPVKAASTMVTEARCLRYFEDYLTNEAVIEPGDVATAHVRDYLRMRLDSDNQNRKGKKLSPNTVNRDLRILKYLLGWATECGWLVENPIQGMPEFSQDQSNLRFMTREEIEERISRGGYTGEEMGEMWKFRYLPSNEMAEFLDLARDRDGEFYPTVCAYACTGARRAELLRLEWSDVDQQRHKLWFTSKKQRRTVQKESREVPISDRLADAFNQQYALTGGERYVIGGKEEVPGHRVYKRFKRIVRGSEYEKLGIHGLRHSFASNLAAAGVDDRVIDKLMGNVTESMRKRYQHLRPQQKTEAIDKLGY